MFIRSALMTTSLLFPLDEKLNCSKSSIIIGKQQIIIFDRLVIAGAASPSWAAHQTFSDKFRRKTVLGQEIYIILPKRLLDS